MHHRIRLKDKSKKSAKWDENMSFNKPIFVKTKVIIPLAQNPHYIPYITFALPFPEKSRAECLDNQFCGTLEQKSQAEWNFLGEVI